MLHVTVRVLIVIFVPAVQATHPTGHLEKLGSHQASEGHVDVLDGAAGFPHPVDFYRRYVERQRPVVIRQAVASIPALQKWTDKFLEEEYGDVEIGIETLKKEDRNNPGELIPLQEFLQRYKKEDIYMVDSLPQAMHKDWMIPHFLLCGGYTDNLSTIYSWLSSGGTSSVLHVDQYENFHCVVNGYKAFIIIDRQYLERIGMDNKERGYYEMDVDRVDLEKYRGLVGVPWYEATVHRGDCLYLPYSWLHQVRSYPAEEQKNMGVNLWWHPFKFNETDCEVRDIPQYASVDQFTPRPALVVRSMLRETARKDGYVYFTDFHDMIQKRVSLPEEAARQVFGYIDSGNEGRVAVDVLEELDYGVFKLMMESMSAYAEEELEDREETDNVDQHFEPSKDEL